MSVSIFFIILLMSVLLGYMAYRLFLQRKLLLIVPICLQIFALTVAVIGFIRNVHTSNMMEILYILLGIAMPGAFLMFDYRNMMEKVRIQGVKGALIQRAGGEAAEIVQLMHDKTQEDIVSEISSDIKVSVSQKIEEDCIKYYREGTACYQEGLKEEAIKYFIKALKINPDSFENYYNMGIVLDDLGRQDEAVKAFERAIELKCDFINAYNNLGIILSTQGKVEEALKIYAEGISKNPRDYSLYYNMGITLSEAGMFKDAVKALRHALELNPDEYEISYHLGAALTEAGQYAEAVEAYKSALKVKPTDCELFYNLSIVYSLLRKPQIAIDNLKKAIELNTAIKRDAKTNRAFDGIRHKNEFKELVS